jgi:hypothetical protein
MMQWLGILLMAMLLAAAPGYASAEPPGTSGAAPAAQPQGSEVKAEPAGALPSYTPKEKKDYQKKTAAELAAVQEKIIDLKLKAGTGRRQSRRMIPQSANHLQAQTLAAKDQLAALEKAPDPTWGELKTEMNKTMDKLAKDLQTVEAQVK